VYSVSVVASRVTRAIAAREAWWVRHGMHRLTVKMNLVDIRTSHEFDMHGFPGACGVDIPTDVAFLALVVNITWAGFSGKG
jgi:hypothetical protein